MTDGVQQIDYGIFIMPFCSSGKPLAKGYDEDLELIVRAEAPGCPELWIGQMA